MSERKESGLSRRDFLRIAGLALGALAFSQIPGSDRLRAPDQLGLDIDMQKVPPVPERFREAVINDIYGIRRPEFTGPVEGIDRVALKKKFDQAVKQINLRVEDVRAESFVLIDSQGREQLVLFGVDESKDRGAIESLYFYTEIKDLKFVPPGHGDESRLLPMAYRGLEKEVVLGLLCPVIGKDGRVYRTIVTDLLIIDKNDRTVTYKDPYSGRSTDLYWTRVEKIAQAIMFSNETGTELGRRVTVTYRLPWGCKKGTSGWEQDYVSITREVDLLVGPYEDTAAFCDTKTGFVPVENYKPFSLEQFIPKSP